MNAFLDALVLALIISPIDPPPIDHSPALLAALQRVSHSLDVTTPGREHWGQFGPELNWVRTNYRIVRDCPPSREAERFRTDQAGTNFLFAVEWTNHLERERAWCRGDLLLEQIAAESQDCMHIWSSLRTINDPASWTVARRHALDRIRTVIGEERYAAGAVPPPVPLWRFREVRP